jgi:hypothetical protein
MISSGIRLGSWDFLRWQHIEPIINENEEIMAAKLCVYAGDAEEYYTFITPEAYKALKEWMDFRTSYGEKITGNSWVIRDLWQTTNMNYGAFMFFCRFLFSSFSLLFMYLLTTMAATATAMPAIILPPRPIIFPSC